jgi:hypothetical protein
LRICLRSGSGLAAGSGHGERRDILDADLRQAESQLRLLPSVMTADLQIDTAARPIS